MIATILVILIILWILGYAPLSVNIPDITLFVFNGRPISLWDLLILAIVGWAIGVLPSPFREIASVLLLLWVLSTLGILAVAGLANIIVLVIIGGLILSLIRGR
jgi:hypothetical protein